MLRSALDTLFSLSGRVVLATGASGGIGSEIASSLAAAGAKVALTGRSADGLERVRGAIEQDGGTAAVFAGDIADPEFRDTLVGDVVRTLGSIDVLVNCAGINKREPIAEVQPATFDHLIDVNLRAPYFLTQAVLPHMIERGGGKVINIGSLTTGWGVGKLSVYGMTKSALGQLTRATAVEWARHNIQVNCLCPGWIKTDLTRPLWSDEQRSRWILDRVPMARFGDPQDLSGLTIYLASAAGNYTTGQVIYVDGGFMAGGEW